MSFALEYHQVVNRPVQRPIPAVPLFVRMLLLPFFLISTSPAQMNSANASANFGHSVSAAPPTSSIAPPTGSIAPRTGSVAPPTSSAQIVKSGFAPSSSGIAHSTNFPHTHGGLHDGSGHHPQHHTSNTSVNSYPYAYGVAVPYTLDATDASAENNDVNGDDDQGSVAASDPEMMDSDTPESATALTSEQPQPATVLVFKDGHQLEIANYAIVSPTLYDLTPGHPRKIALADLDLPATQKQNDDHGVVFQLPSTAQAN